MHWPVKVNQVHADAQDIKPQLLHNKERATSQIVASTTVPVNWFSFPKCLGAVASSPPYALEGD